MTAKEAGKLFKAAQRYADKADDIFSLHMSSRVLTMKSGLFFKLNEDGTVSMKKSWRSRSSVTVG